MKWVGFICLAIMLYYSSYPGRVQELEDIVEKHEKIIRKNKKTQERNNNMSKIIEGLVGKRCEIYSDDLVLDESSVCDVLDVDDEWIKLRCTDRKNNVSTKIIRIDSIDSVELVED